MIARALATASAATVASLLAIAVAGPAAAAPAYPAAHGRCVDQVGVLGDDLCSRVTAILRADEKATTDEIAVAVVPTTGDASIESWSTGLFNHWGVGKATRDNGVLLVVAVDDRRVRLETGRGMTERLDGSAAAVIVDTVITPHFKADEYALGVLDGLDEVRRVLGHEVTTGTELVSLAESIPPVADDSTVVTRPDGEFTSLEEDPAGGSSPTGAFFLIAFLFVGLGTVGFLLSRAGGGSGGTTHGRRNPAQVHRTHHISYFPSTTDSSSSGGSSSGSDFGGGSSTGGGASGSW